ncbi:MAG TPA: HNH endonuclease, partial [Clostridiaceae bacterium]|nr:HNH endonuclease [Clostridiaceae bacterium]
ENTGLIGVSFKTKNILFKKCIADGDFQQTKGIRSEQRIITDKIQGFRKFDKVKYQGKEYFIKG